MSKLMNNMKIRSMIIFGTALLLALLLAMGAASILFTRSISDDTRILYDRPHTNLVDMWRVKTKILEVGNGLNNASITHQAPSQTVAEGLKDTQALLDQIEKNKVDPSQPRSANMQAILDACDAWTAQASAVSGMLSSGVPVPEDVKLAFDELQADLLTKMDAIIQTATDNALKFRNQSVEAAKRSEILLAVLFAAALLLSMGVLYTILNRIARPVKILLHSAGEIAKGHFDNPVDYDSRNEFGVLAERFRTMEATLRTIIADISRLLSQMGSGDFTAAPQADYIGDFAPILDSMRQISARLSETLGEITRAADEVAGGSDQVSAGAQNLAQGATEQAGTIEQLSASINEVARHVEGSAQGAAEASSRAAEAAGGMQEGRRQMERLTGAIRRVSESAGEIGNVIKTIEDIAFQTNILALNAAVEAARAGAAGKGFAVVADEVRNLANKSSEAAKSTTAMIETSIQAIEEGDRITQQTATSFMEIADSTQAAAEQVRQISQAAEKQRLAMEEITTGIDQISAVVQNNSATAEQSAAASANLNMQAQALKSLTARFVLQEPSVAVL